MMMKFSFSFFGLGHKQPSEKSVAKATVFLFKTDCDGLCEKLQLPNFAFSGKQKMDKNN